ncbi:MAG: lipocalin family protein [Bacteroidaceae bacterium]|nr:lipocalin family protein [Bacteroidaceae bacterium]
MKKISIALIAFVALGLFSCEEKKKELPKPPVEIRALEEMPSIVEAHGTIGEGSSMNVMEFVSDSDDTIYINVPVQAVMGGVRVGDEVKVIYNISDDDIFASLAVNLTSLQHLWVQRGADGREQSLELDSGGRATTYNMSVDYDSWEVKAGQLLLHVPKRIGDEAPAVVDTFEIMQLTSDSLVLMNGDFMTEFERYN